MLCNDGSETLFRPHPDPIKVDHPVDLNHGKCSYLNKVFLFDRPLTRFQPPRRSIDDSWKPIASR